MKNKKTVLTILSCVLVFLLAGIAYFGSRFVRDEVSVPSYRQQVELGDKYLAEQDYQSAIAAYRAAVEEDETDEEAYYKLAMLYFDLNQMENAKQTLIKGIAKTNSRKLIDLYEERIGVWSVQSVSASATEDVSATAGEDIKDTVSTHVSVDNSLCAVIANYTMDDFTMFYNTSSSTAVGGVYEVSFSNFDGTLSFFNADNTVVINPVTRAPYANMRPNYVTFANLHTMFSSLESGKTYGLEDLQDWGFDVPYVDHDPSMGKFVTFKHMNCIFRIGSDDDGTFTADSWCRLSSSFGLGDGGAPAGAFAIALSFLDATNAAPLAGAFVTITPKQDSGTAPIDGTVDGSGGLTVNLPVGEYSVSIACEGYISDTFDLSIDTTGVPDKEGFALSPLLPEGAIRIVLTWGATPRDLDSHLLVDNDAAKHVSFVNKRPAGANAYLDTDDTNGYGPETITIYDLSSEYEYYVHRFSSDGSIATSDAVVRVYQSDGTVLTFTPPEGFIAFEWHVFRIINGEIIPIENY